MLKLDETTSNMKSWQFQLSTLGFQFQLDSVGSDGVAKMVNVDLIRIIFGFLNVMFFIDKLNIIYLKHTHIPIFIHFLSRQI